MKGHVRARAHAKLNLHLAVLGRRDDGYHELDTVMAAIALADELELRVVDVPGLRLRLAGPFASADIPQDGRNLALAAVAAGFERAQALGSPSPRGAELELIKNVPSRAGLGGGSSDAQAALRLVEQLLEVDLGARWRQDWLASVGSDTVFFDTAGPGLHARCTGRGERVQPCPALPADWSVLVVTPAIEASTGAIFGALGETRLDAPAVPPDFAQLSLAQARSALRNDLEAAALRAIPELAEWAQRLRDALGHGIRMTGSGSSFFTLCESAAEGRERHEQIESLGIPTRLVWCGPFAQLLASSDSAMELP